MTIIDAKLVPCEVSRPFRSPDDLFQGLGADALSALTTANSDLAVVLSPEGGVLDVAYGDKGLGAWGIDGWIGRSFVETVTVESRSKIEDLLKESAVTSPTRSRQVNHPATAGRDLPIGYRVVSFPGRPHRIAFGTDLRAMADMQQRLVLAQIEMERDYRKLRDAETRYRILFQLAIEPLLVVEGQSLKILEANDGAARLLGRTVEKLLGSAIPTIFAKNDQAAVTDAFRAIETRARPDLFRARQSASERMLCLRLIPFRDFGRTNLLVRLSEDGIDDAARIAEPEDPMSQVARALPDGVVVVDSNATIVEANPAFLDLVRVPTPDLVEERSLDNWLGGSGVDVQVLMANLREHGTMRRFSSIIRDEYGGREKVEVSATRFSGPDGPLFGISIREVPASDGKPSGFGSHNPGSTAQLTDLVGRVPLKDLVRDSADIIEKLCIEAALRLTDNNRASAADMLGLSRQSLYIKLKRYGISDQEGPEG
ncbi:MAG: transcriptional regulator PpsR [Rhizobiaceae bacterium]|nr:transcriptional regulator PpsR [Rhizobiaceae bacterium]